MKKVLLVILAILLLLPGCKKKELMPDEVAGVYARHYQDEIEGEVIDIVDKITLRSDMTCTVDFQDTIDGTWDTDGKIKTGLSEDTFKIDGNKLTLVRSDDGLTFEFIKED